MHFLLAQVRIDVYRRLRLAVAQVSLRREHVYARVVKNRRVVVPKLVEAENKICYNADRLWLCRGLFLYGREDYTWYKKAGSITL